MNGPASLRAAAPDDTAKSGPLDDPALRWPQFDDDERDAVAEVLATGRVNALVHGDCNRRFEKAFADYVGAPHAIALANGTLALELGLRALGIGPGDEVIVPARSFFASAAAVVAVGADPVFADIAADSQGMHAASARAMISSRTAAILCVHLGGFPCDMDALVALADEHDLFLIEDCAQAHGAEWRGCKVGSFGDAAAFSFCTDKIMSTGGEGGMLLLKDRDHWARAWAYKDHGKNPEKVFAAHGGTGFRYIHDSFGTNWRLTEMQAAIGEVQLAKLDGWLGRRRGNAAILAERLGADARLVVPPVPDHAAHAFYRFYVRLADGEGDATPVIAAMNARGLPAAAGSCPDMSLESAFADRPPPRDGDLATAHAVGRTAIALPVDHLLDASDMHRLADGLRDALDALEAQQEMRHAV
ncbi:DegT/DnrJ/EryC1/StrS family aminotransferase [Aurantiacibacter spongiae]|uniref:DegT/DnrJ/EryC1/StrS aminotransferase family protein n=1 Tax=Aurantiacibacter spongiae TaxID=2488860 RepID=A0A3N5CUP8_9SPHN|nr:DegT/DnrJ/EryC1/StrS aminotransferase family protein [Aurantiacibacter spongiae]RPF71170.1 DegT/DnrJ/EryC1/StrS aminotransferase family protein [Aurantiacibacter spongiae]